MARRAPPAKGTPARDENVQPRNFSDNEFAAFMISMICGCNYEINERDVKKVADLQWLWSNTELDCARMSDAAYTETVQDKYWTQLENAREALRKADGA
jgi:hypothetical protein